MPYYGRANDEYSRAGEGIGKMLAAWFILRPQIEKQRALQAMIQASERASVTRDPTELENLSKIYGREAEELFTKTTGMAYPAPYVGPRSPAHAALMPPQAGAPAGMPPGLLDVPGSLGPPQQRLPFPTEPKSMELAVQNALMRGEPGIPIEAQIQHALAPYIALSKDVTAPELRRPGYETLQAGGAIPEGPYPTLPISAKDLTDIILNLQKGYGGEKGEIQPSLVETVVGGKVPQMPTKPYEKKAERPEREPYRVPFTEFLKVYKPSLAEVAAWKRDGTLPSRAPVLEPEGGAAKYSPSTLSLAWKMSTLTNKYSYGTLADALAHPEKMTPEIQAEFMAVADKANRIKALRSGISLALQTKQADEKTVNAMLKEASTLLGIPFEEKLSRWEKLLRFLHITEPYAELDVGTPTSTSMAEEAKQWQQ